MKEIILASASPRRKELLTQIGIPFRIRISQKEEVILQSSPTDIVKDLSYTKAKDVFDREKSDVIVIGADTIVVYEEKILGKPQNEEEACQMINMLQGKTHQVYTGVTLIWGEAGNIRSSSFYEKTDVELYDMSEEEILSYIATKEPYDKAGGYGIQGYFARYVKQITGDYNNVVGLPVGKLYQIMNSLELLS